MSAIEIRRCLCKRRSDRGRAAESRLCDRVLGSRASSGPGCPGDRRVAECEARLVPKSTS